MTLFSARHDKTKKSRKSCRKPFASWRFFRPALEQLEDRWAPTLSPSMIAGAAGPGIEPPRDLGKAFVPGPHADVAFSSLELPNEHFSASTSDAALAGQTFYLDLTGAHDV